MDDRFFYLLNLIFLQNMVGDLALLAFDITPLNVATALNGADRASICTWPANALFL